MKSDSSEKGFVRNEVDKRKGSSLPLVDAFKYAASGLSYVIRTQRNIRIEALFALLALVLGLVLAIPLSSWLAVIICFGLVFSAECLNTALESVVDLVAPEYELLAKRAKDCAAAAVLVSSLISLVVAIAVFGSALIDQFGLMG